MEREINFNNFINTLNDLGYIHNLKYCKNDFTEFLIKTNLCEIQTTYYIEKDGFWLKFESKKLKYNISIDNYYHNNETTNYIFEYTEQFNNFYKAIKGLLNKMGE